MRDILEGLGLGAVKDGLILFGDGQFWVNGDYDIVTDQEKIDRCYISMSHEETPRGEELSEYIETLLCFGGSFLEHSKASPWINEARAHYDKVYLQLLDCCMEAMAKAGDYSRADVIWNSALQLKPRELDVHERLLRGFLKENRFAEAATYYAKLAVQFANTEQRLPEFDYFMG
jgi:DNA-binding SARP family transcriptional activator